MSTTYGNIILGADNLKLGLGNAGIADAYITFDGTDLVFFDATVNATKTLTQLTTASGVSTLDGAFDGGKIIDGATSLANAFQVGGANDKLTVHEEASNDIRVGTTAGANLTVTAAGGAISFGDENLTTTGTFNIGADSVNLTLGASGATDSYLQFNGTDLVFYSSALGTTITLTALAANSSVSPAITGNPTIINNTETTGDVLALSSATLTSGTGVKVSTVDATMTTGYYYEAYNGAATVFGVKRYGATTIAGNASTDVLTLTAGDMQITAGDIDMDLGIITIDNTADEGNKIARNNATGTAPVLEVEQTHATGGVAFLVDQDATGDVNAVEITNAGTGFAVTTTGAVAGSRGYEFISAASGTGSAFLADGTTGGAAWVGAAGTGLIQAQSDGALADVAASLCYLAYSGNAAGANQTGSCINVVETGAASGTSYAVGISSTNNNGMNISVGAVGKTNLTLTGVASQTASIEVVDGVTNNWIGANGVGMVHLKSDGALAHANAALLYATYTGNTGAVVPVGACLDLVENGTVAAGGYVANITATTGNGLQIATTAAATTALKLACGANTTSSIASIDGATADWIGAATTGMLSLNCDGAVVADASLLRITSSGQPAAANDGICLEMVESGAAQATSYVMRIASTNNEAIHIDSGVCLFDENCTWADGANINLGGAPTARATTEPTNAINLVNGTAPVGAAANTVTLYAAAGELRVMDAGGNSTLLSPHDDLDYWVYDSTNTETGKHLHIDVERIFFALVEKFPELAQYITVEMTA